MRWVLAIFASLIALLLVAFVVVPEAGGPRPGRLFERTTVAECRGLLTPSKLELFERASRTMREMSKEGDVTGPLSVSELRDATRVSPRWVWLSRGYGWGCQFEYPGGEIERTPPRL